MNYYNEWDAKTAAWLRELIKQGLIPYGVVDERSITEVTPGDLVGFTQCHFFAGIGGWPLALQLAGIPADKPLWTGSPPCQPFSVAGARKGRDDPRHLAPTFLDLVADCKPPILFWEQVAAAVTKDAWLDSLFFELEEENYACGFTVLPACSVGAPHKRDRLFFGASLRLGDSASERQCSGKFGQDRGIRKQLEGAEPREHDQYGCANGRLADTDSEQRNRSGNEWSRRRDESTNNCGDRNVADANNTRSQRRKRMPECADKQSFGAGSMESRPDTDHCFWSDSDWIGCRDGKIRPVESGSFPLANGIPARVVRLRGYGNAIVPEVAAEFVKAFMETIKE